MQAVASNVKVKIDRDFGDITLMQMFPIIKVHHIDLVESDHCLVVAELRIHQAPHMRRSARSFRYEDVWQTHADYGKVVKELWEAAQHGSGISGLMSLSTRCNLVWINGERQRLEILRKAGQPEKGVGPNQNEVYGTGSITC
jgi:hypothetical protein